MLERTPELILPEQGLVSDEALWLGDPGVFGDTFLDRYEPLSLRFGERYLNLWRLRSTPADHQPAP